MEERWITDKEAAAILGMARQSLANWRAQRRGPVYSVIGRRSIRYRLSDLIRFAESRKVEIRD